VDVVWFVMTGGAERRAYCRGEIRFGRNALLATALRRARHRCAVGGVRQARRGRSRWWNCPMWSSPCSRRATAA